MIPRFPPKVQRGKRTSVLQPSETLLPAYRAYPLECDSLLSLSHGELALQLHNVPRDTLMQNFNHGPQFRLRTDQRRP